MSPLRSMILEVNRSRIKGEIEERRKSERKKKKRGRTKQDDRARRRSILSSRLELPVPSARWRTSRRRACARADLRGPQKPVPPIEGKGPREHDDAGPESPGHPPSLLDQPSCNRRVRVCALRLLWNLREFPWRFCTDLSTFLGASFACRLIRAGRARPTVPIVW